MLNDSHPRGDHNVSLARPERKKVEITESCVFEWRWSEWLKWRRPWVNTTALQLALASKGSAGSIEWGRGEVARDSQKLLVSTWNIERYGLVLHAPLFPSDILILRLMESTHPETFGLQQSTATCSRGPIQPRWSVPGWNRSSWITG